MTEWALLFDARACEQCGALTRNGGIDYKGTIWCTQCICDAINRMPVGPHYEHMDLPDNWLDLVEYA